MSPEKIIFSSPDFEKLNKQGYICVDMHFHSTHSDGASTVKQILEKARNLNIGVAITDHNQINGAVEAYSRKEKDAFIIPGIEVKSTELVDVLFYFYDIEELKKFYEKEILPKKQRLLHTTRTTLTLNEVIGLSEKYKCIISVAHPFGYQLRSNIRGVFEKYESLLEKCDIFEAMNGGNNRKNNMKSVNYIKKNNKGYTGGSDGHSIYPLGNIVTCSKAKNVEEFLDNIKNKKNIVVGKEARLGKIGEYGRFAANKLKNMFSK